MITRVTIEEIARLVGAQLGRKQVQADDRFFEDLGAESSDIANLVAAVEDKYRIQIEEWEIANVRTPADLFDLVQKHLSPAQ